MVEDLIQQLFADISIGTKEEENIFIGLIGNYLRDEEFLLLHTHSHHKNTSRLIHSLHVSYLCFLTGYRHKLDYVSLSIGGLLHDFCLFEKKDYSINKLSDVWCFYHPQQALKKAEEKFELSDISKEVIKMHMFPVTFSIPKYKETYVICYWDKYCAVKEVFQKKRTVIKKRNVVFG